MTLHTAEAWKIAQKLKAEIKSGGKHKQALIRYKGKVVARFGIRHSRKTDHSYIPKQLFINLREAADLAKCPLTRDQYFEILRSQGKLPPDE